MLPQTLRTISTISICVAFSGCATTGGFEPARIATTNFTDGATAGGAFIDARNAALLDATRLSHLQWHTAKTTTSSKHSYNDLRLLQPGDRLDSQKTLMKKLVRSLVCDGELVSDEGTLLIQLSQSAAKSLKTFDFKPSDSTLGNIALLTEKSKPATISLSTTADEEARNTAQSNRFKRCSKDFELARTLSERELTGGGEESLTGAVAAGATAYSTLKDLDKKLAGVLGTVVDVKRRAEFNKFVKENEGAFTELRDQLRSYAQAVDEDQKDSIRLAAMTKYIFAFDEFAKSIVKRKSNSNGTLFTMDMADLSENKKAKSVIDATNAYNSAVNSNPAKPIRELAGSIDDLLALTNPPTHKDLYKQYESAKAFYEALGELADATKDAELKKSLNEIFDQL